MLFRNDEEYELYLLEKGGQDHNLFIKRRSLHVNMLKDFNKSRRTSAQWTVHKNRFLSGMRKWHNSIEGRKFHRQLGRYNATRMYVPKDGLLSTRESIQGDLINLRNFLLVELIHFNTVIEQVDIELMIEQLDLEISSISS
jgi:hypothetical protein